MILKGNKVFLRYLQDDDADTLLKWENDPEVWDVSDTRRIFSRETILQFIQSHQDIYLQKQLRLMICENETNGRLGCVDLFDFESYHSRAGVGILIYDKANRRQGFAQDALELIISFGKDALRLNQVYCNVLEDNEASIKMFRKLGFREIGKKLQWHRNAHGWKNEILLQYLIHPNGS